MFDSCPKTFAPTILKTYFIGFNSVKDGSKGRFIRGGNFNPFTSKWFDLGL